MTRCDRVNANVVHGAHGKSAMSIQVMGSSSRRLAYALGAVILIANLGCPAAVLAAEGDPVASMFSLHGFGTFGEVYSDAHAADFVASPFQPNGAGYSQNWAPGVDSKAGLQLGAQFSDKLSAIVQVVSQHLYDNTWRPQLEWANLKYQVTSDLSIRAGRSVASSLATCGYIPGRSIRTKPSNR